MSGLVLIFLCLSLILAIATLVLILFHAFVFIYICIFGSYTLKIVIVTLHIVWVLLCLRNGRFYGYDQILVSSQPTMGDRGIHLTRSWSIYHSSGSGKRNGKPDEGFRNSIDNTRGPFELLVWGEKRVKEEFPTERWALQRLYQTLDMNTLLSYEEMFILYKQKWGDRIGFCIDVTEYEYKKEIKHFLV